MATDAVWSTAAGLFVIIMGWIFAAFLVYSGIKFRQRKDDVLFTKRRGDLVIKIVCLQVIGLAIGNPILLYLHWPLWIPSIAPNRDTVAFFVVDLLNDLTYTMPLWMGAWITFLRYWMIYYDIQLSNSCTNLQWKACITTSINSDKNNTEQWFIAHKKNLGNGPFMLKCTLIFSLTIIIYNITNSTLILFHVIEHDYYTPINVLLFLAMWITIIVLWKKIPFFNDNIYLYKEFVVTGQFWIIVLLIYLISGIWTGFTTHWSASFAFYGSAAFGAFIIPFISTFWVLKQVDATSDVNLALGIVGLTRNRSRSKSNTTSTHPTNTFTGSGKSILREILYDNDTFNLFMAHLINEFSMECLLSVIEFAQFKTHAMDMLNIDTADLDSPSSPSHSSPSTPSISSVRVLTRSVSVAVFEQQITFPADVPQSDIVYGPSPFQNDVDVVLAFKNKAYRLYRKYVKTGAEYEINVSYRIRGRLDKYMSNYDEWMNHDTFSKYKLVTLFDDATKEMIKLLDYSRSRFKFERI